jgi:uncharacterized protein HemX
MENNTAVIIALVSATATLIGGGYAAWVQLKRDRAAGNVELVKLQEDIERELWNRTKSEFADMRLRIDAQQKQLEAQQAQISANAITMQEQGALIMQHRERIRVLELERDDWKRRAETAEGKQGKQGRNL